MGQANQEVYCERCGTAQPIHVTVPWQPDMCAECGSDIKTEDE